MNTPTRALNLIAIVLLSAAIPVQAVELIVNGNFDAGFTGFSSDYAFVPSGTSTTPGTFGIRSFSQNFNPGFDAFGDHTTGTGNMMLVDGAPSPNVTVWQETVSILPNTDYTFSAWATTANGTNTPTLRFRINAIQVGSDFQLVVPSGTWQNFTTVWNSGSSTSAAIAIVDTNTISLGNDFGLDDISFSGVPEPSASILVTLGSAFALFYRRRRNGRNG